MNAPIINWLVDVIIQYGEVFCLVIMVIFAVRYLLASKGKFNEKAVVDLALVGMATHSFIPGLLFIIMGINPDLISERVDVVKKLSWYLLIYGFVSLYIAVNFLSSKWQKKPVKTGE